MLDSFFIGFLVCTEIEPIDRVIKLKYSAQYSMDIYDLAFLFYTFASRFTFGVIGAPRSGLGLMLDGIVRSISGG